MGKPVRRKTAADDRAPDVTTGGFLTMWLDSLTGTVAPATEQRYRTIVRLYVGPHLGSTPLATLQSSDVTAMVRSLDEAGKAGNTQRLARSILRRSVRWGHAEGLVSRTVATNVRSGDQRDGRSLTVAEGRTLLATVEPHRLGAAFVALSLGLRVGELLALTRSDVILDDGPARLAVIATLKRTGDGLVVQDLKARGSRRTLHLPGPAASALRTHLAAQAAERAAAGGLWLPRPLGRDLVFRTELGAGIDPANFRHLVYRMTEESGLGRWSPRELRRCAAVLQMAQGVRLELVS